MKPQTSNKLHQLEVVDQALFVSLHFRPYILYSIDLEAREMDKLLRRPFWIFADDGLNGVWVTYRSRTQSLVNARPFIKRTSFNSGGCPLEKKNVVLYTLKWYFLYGESSLFLVQSQGLQREGAEVLLLNLTSNLYTSLHDFPVNIY